MSNTSAGDLSQKNRLSLRLYIQPKAGGSSAFVGLHNGYPKIRINAPPVDGKANAALIAFLAETFSIPKSAVTLRQGAQSRFKTVIIENPQRIPDWAADSRE